MDSLQFREYLWRVAEEEEKKKGVTMGALNDDPHQMLNT